MLRRAPVPARPATGRGGRAYSPGGWRATNPRPERFVEVQRDPFSPIALVS